MQTFVGISKESYLEKNAKSFARALGSCLYSAALNREVIIHGDELSVVSFYNVSVPTNSSTRNRYNVRMRRAVLSVRSSGGNAANFSHLSSVPAILLSFLSTISRRSCNTVSKV